MGTALQTMYLKDSSSLLYSSRVARHLVLALPKLGHRKSLVGMSCIGSCLSSLGIFLSHERFERMSRQIQSKKSLIMDLNSGITRA